MDRSNIANLVQSSKAITYWLQERKSGLSVTNDKESLVVAGCFDMTQEHQEAVAILIDYQLYGSVFALARSIFESYVRGVWLRNCATEEQWKAYLDDKFQMKLWQLIDDIEKIEKYSPGYLSGAKELWIKTLNGFTHSGIIQVSRRVTKEGIGSNYSDDDITEIVRFVNNIALLAGLEIVTMSEEKPESVVDEFSNKIEEYVSEARPEQGSKM